MSSCFSQFGIVSFFSLLKIARLIKEGKKFVKVLLTFIKIKFYSSFGRKKESLVGESNSWEVNSFRLEV
jgi:hypothetical protein